MSGFLHKLAARTLGLAPPVRPRAALPYAAPQADFPGAELPGQQVATDPARPDTDVAGSPLQAASHENGRHTPAPQAAATPRAVDHTAESTDSALRYGPYGAASAPAPHPMRPAGTMHPVASWPASQRDPGFRPQQLPATPEPARATAASSLDAAQERFGDLDTLVSRLLGQGKDDNQNTPPRPGPDLVPASITAPAGSSTIRTWGSAEQPLRPIPAAEPDATPEVHITIGRLEVNPPSRPPPPPAPRGPAPLSLADYLARRHGSRS